MHHSYDFVKKKNALRRNWLREDIPDDFQYYYSFDELSFYKISGMSNFWSDRKFDFNMLFSDILTGISSAHTEFAYIIACNKYAISIYAGISRELAPVLERGLHASYPYLKLDAQEFEDIEFMVQNTGTAGGLITGIPTNKIKDDPQVMQIEKLLKGLYGQKWAYIVTAKGVNSQHITELWMQTLDEMRELSPKIQWTLDRQGATQEERLEYTDSMARSYYEDLEMFVGKLMDASGGSLWRCCCYYIAQDDLVAHNMGRLLKTIFAGSESVPEPVRNIPLANIQKAAGRGLGLINDKLNDEELNFLALKSPDIEPFSFYNYRMQNMLNSQDLAVFCQIPKEEAPGYYIDNYVKFDLTERRTGINFSIGNIVYDGTVLNKNEYKIDLNSLNRHGLVTGITGGGKTNTLKHILSTLWSNHKKPFMVIESAKREYWELAGLPGLENLNLFTMGFEGKNAVKYRLNPFERVGDTSLQTHIDYLLSAFKASFELYAPMPYVLEMCVYEVYSDRGWDVLEDENVLDRDDYPTLEDLYHKIEVVVDRLGYDKKLRSDIIAALRARVSSLMVGGKGAMLNTQKSLPIDRLLDSPALLELEDIGDDDVKAFIIGAILVQLYEYRKSTPAGVRGLKHVLLIEEAHRLLQNVTTYQSAESANPRGKAVEFFCNLLAEIRSYGQGILIADQMPTKLAPDVLKNTNLKITHRIVTREDRELIGSAMNMTPEQIEYMSTFRTGFAAVYSEGDSRPKLVKLPYIEHKDAKPRGNLLREVNARVKVLAGDIYARFDHGLACSLCTKRCKFRAQIAKLVSTGVISEKFLSGVGDYINKYGIFNEYTLKSIADRIEHKVVKRKLILDEKLCILNYVLPRVKVCSDSYKKEAVVKFIKVN